jgi:hypothetical protein
MTYLNNGEFDLRFSLFFLDEALSFASLGIRINVYIRINPKIPSICPTEPNFNPDLSTAKNP